MRPIEIERNFYRAATGFLRIEAASHKEFAKRSQQRQADQDVDSYQKRKLLQSVVSPLAKRFEMEIPDPNMNEQFLTELLAAHYEREYRRLG